MSDNDRFPPTLRVGILVFDGFEPIDVWGFTEAFAISRFIGSGSFPRRFARPSDSTRQRRLWPLPWLRGAQACRSSLRTRTTVAGRDRISGSPVRTGAFSSRPVATAKASA